MGTRLKVNIVYAKRHQQYFEGFSNLLLTVRRMPTKWGPIIALISTGTGGLLILKVNCSPLLLLTILSDFNDN